MRAMADTVPLQANAQHLTDILRRTGVLGGGDAVTDVVMEVSRTMLVSPIARLRLTYSADVGAAPTHLLFKGRRADLDFALAESGRKECDFDTTVAAATPRASSRAVTRLSPLRKATGIFCWRISRARMRRRGTGRSLRAGAV
jgi:hypothetical protein